MRYIFLYMLTIIGLIFSETALAFDSLEKIRQSQFLAIGVRESPPFAFTNSDGQTMGYAIDLCLKVADAIKKELKISGLKVKFISVDSTTRFSSLIDGSIDLECGSTTNNAERRKKFDFTIPHFFSSVRAVVRTESGIRNWNQFRNRTIVTTKSTTTVKLLNDRNDVNSLNIKLIEGDSDFDSFKMVEAFKADAFAMDDVLLYSLRADSKDPNKFAIIGDPLSVEPYSIMMRKGDLEFKRIVDSEMLRIIYSGEIYKIYDRWFMRPIPPKGSNMNMPMGFLLRDSLRFPNDHVGD